MRDAVESRSNRQTCMTFDGDVRENLLCLLEMFCLMPRTKFGSDTMLNIIIISNAMCYTMLCMLEWMRKGKYRVGTLRTQELRGSAFTAYIHGGIP